MNSLRKVALVIIATFALVAPVNAQWQVPNHAVPIGQGGGNIGFNSVLPGAAGTVLTSNGVGADPSYKTTSTASAIPGASGSIQTTTGSITSGQSTLTLVGAVDFANGQNVRCEHCGAALTLNQPTALAVTPTGATGATAYAYTIATLSNGYGVGQSIANVATATGNATLSDTNYNHLAWTAPTGTAPRGYAIYGNKAGSLALIGYTVGTTFDDSGLGAITPPAWLPAAPQTGASLADALIATISSGGGTTTLTLAAPALTTASSVRVSHDDTAALQSAITAALGSSLTLPAGTFNLSSPLTITNGITLLGVGYTGDQAHGFPPNNSSVASCANLIGTALCPDVLFDTIDATTNNAVHMSHFQVTYPSPPLLDTSSILLNSSTPGGPLGNSQSSFTDLMLTGHCVGLNLQNVLDSVVAFNHVLYGYCGGIAINAPNFSSFVQNKVIGNQVWGNGYSSALKNVYAYHIQLQAGGDLVVSGNKLNAGGPNTNAILLIGQSSGVQNMEPMIITGNSAEGAANCLTVNSGNASFTADALTIVGNQFWCGSKSILINTNGASPYVFALTVTGNTLMINGGSGLLNMLIDGVSNGIIAGNVFSVGGPLSGSNTALDLGSHTTGVNVQSNAYDAGYTTKIVNFGTGNTTGGGSM